tara:strand:+ start:44102 stop:44764 length:663 start_codon:yes stop_codon:yes gene_type:complete
MRNDMKSLRLTKTFAACAFAAMTLSSYSFAGNLQDTEENTLKVSDIPASIAKQYEYRAPGYKWGDSNVSQQTYSAHWETAAASTPNFKWASTDREPSTDAALGSASVSGDPSDSGAGVVSHAGYRWGIRNVADQAGYRWGIRNVADQAGYRWGIRNVADQAGYRWGIRNVADQAGYRWGIRYVADQAGYRWGIRNVADQAGYRWGIRNVADQAGYRWGIR